MRTLISKLARTAPLIHRTRTPSGIFKRAKYVARGLIFSRYTQEWFDFLNRPQMSIVIRHHPYLYHKLQRPYLNCTLSTRQRLDALKQHYSFVLDQFSPAMMESLYATTGIKFAEFHLKSLGPFELRLSCSRRQKEGDFSIAITKKGSESDLFAIAFSVWRYQTGKEIFIGGLQGNRAATKEVIVLFTRELYGMRPKSLLLFAVQQIAMWAGIPNLRAVSDTKHIYRHFQKRKVLAASYDNFWFDCGGRLSPDGMFELPATFIPRDISTIKVNKRQMYRRRYDLLENIARQVHIQLENSMVSKC
jgi:uncharacterized protein VirK/YbjX